MVRVPGQVGRGGFNQLTDLGVRAAVGCCSYATHRSGAIKIENATALTISDNTFTWVGGNAVVLSASVRNVTVTANLFRYLGTSGVAVQGKTGAALMDGRDGEAMMAAHGPKADNGVRLPRDNVVSHNMFIDYGVW